MRIVDLFAGIGGFHYASANWGTVIYANEFDKFAARQYELNHRIEVDTRDIRNVPTTDIPFHDVLIAGFPCQPFSMAGISKRNSMNLPSGILDTRGTLFHEILRIVEDRRPKAVLMENVANLFHMEGGKTFETIKTSFERLNYVFYAAILDASIVVPQHRRRLYMIAWQKDDEAPIPLKSELLDTYPLYHLGVKGILEQNVDPKYTLSDRMWKTLQNHAKRHADKGNGFGYGLVTPETRATRTLLARYFKDGSDILVQQSDRNPRRLTPRECARLMGFPEEYRIECSDTQAYKQFGNAVVVPLAEQIVYNIYRTTRFDALYKPA